MRTDVLVQKRGLWLGAGQSLEGSVRARFGTLCLVVSSRPLEGSWQSVLKSAGQSVLFQESTFKSWFSINHKGSLIYKPLKSQST